MRQVLGGAAQAARLPSAGRRGAPGAASRRRRPPAAPPPHRSLRLLRPPAAARSLNRPRPPSNRAGGCSRGPAAVPDVGAMAERAPGAERRETADTTPSAGRRAAAEPIDGRRRPRRHVSRAARSGAGSPAARCVRRAARASRRRPRRDARSRRWSPTERDADARGSSRPIVDRAAPSATAARPSAPSERLAPDAASPMSSSGSSANWRQRLVESGGARRGARRDRPAARRARASPDDGRLRRPDRPGTIGDSARAVARRLRSPMSTQIPPHVPDSPALEGLEARFAERWQRDGTYALRSHAGRATRSTPSTRRRRR